MQNVHAMRAEVRADYELALGWIDGDVAFAVRFERFFTELRDPLFALYGDDPRFEAAWRRLLEAIARTAAGRSAELRALDHEREITPDWLQREQAVGYVTYVDRFAGTLSGVREKLPYLRELGVTYLHLMPLLHARPAPNDGGYAVVDYGAVEPSLGSMDDLRALADDLRAAGMALCVDLVLNHTAAEHEWARERPDFYRTFADRTEPDAYERTLPEVFPDTAPGSFTFDAGLDRWVWTTFNAYQWDLDYTNPDVFVAMTEAMLGLAEVGVDVLRLDAAPFLWKRVGTNCQNQPEVHELLQAFRAAMRIAAPAVAFKAEAIVAPRDLVPYLGTGRHEGKECDLAYHNVLMVLLWSALASGRVALMTSTLRAMPPVPPGAGLADLRALPRRHRLGDHARGRGPGRRGRLPAPALPGRLLRRRLPGHVRPRRPLPARPADGRGADLRLLRVAGGPGERAGRGRRGAGGAAHPAPARGRLRPRRAAADLHGRRARPAQRRDLPRRPAQARRQPLDAPARDGLGGGRAPPRPRDRRRPAVGGPAAADRRPPRDPRDPRPGRRPSRSGRATTTSSGSCASRRASRCWSWRTSPPTRSRCR